MVEDRRMVGVGLDVHKSWVRLAAVSGGGAAGRDDAGV